LLKILIADDHAIVRAGLREILRDAPEQATVAEASDGRQALDMALNNDWDVVVLDITMPGVSGLEVLRAIKRKKPKLPVVMLSMHAAPAYVGRALQEGAAGYVSKETAPDEILTALRTVLAGKVYVSPGLNEGRAGSDPK
jgi:DNA-binding NarL/FixJ family response regulator